MLTVAYIALYSAYCILGARAIPATRGATNICDIQPLGEGQDDTDQVKPTLPFPPWLTSYQVEAAIAQCGHYGTTVFAPGEYNITR